VGDEGRFCRRGSGAALRLATSAVAVGFLLALAAPALAVDTGAIRGVVVDTVGGAAITNVSVRLQSSGRSVITDGEGRFEFRDVAAGDQELYVSAVDFILVKRTIAVAPHATVEVTIALTEGAGAYRETVDVHALAPMTRREPAVAAAQTLAGRELQQLRGILTNDPLRAVQVLPAVAAGDDFHSEFAVRGAGVDRMTFTFEGIATPFLLHTVQQVHDGGSVAMVNGDVLEEISLLNGAYPQRHGDRTGAEIDFRMREGSRDRMQSHVAVSAIDASAVVEGPLGSSRRGAWLFSARRSYLDLIVKRLSPEQNLSFGFTDAQAKFVYDVAPRHQLQFAMTGGESLLERDPNLLAAGNLREATNRSAVGVATWRYLPSASVSVTQRVAVAANMFHNASRDGAELDGGDGRDLVYRVDVSLAPAAASAGSAAGPQPAASGVSLVELGGELRRQNAAGHEQRLTSGRFQTREDFDSGASVASAYAQVRLAPAAGRWSLTPGLRVDRHALVERTTASPWVQALVPISGAVTLRAGAGVHHQEPGFAEILGSRGTPTLDVERAYHGDVGIEGRIGSAARWQVTVYDREDRRFLRLPFGEMHVVNGVLVNASATSHYVNALDGHARGVEWVLQRQSPNGFSGWASYAYGVTTYRDRTTAEEFFGDYDQRHTVNLYGMYRVSDRLSLSSRFRAGSNFPTTGYWAARDGLYFAGTDRNTVRVPVYARLDARANRTFTWERRRLTLFVEAINVLNRENVRFSIPSVDRRTLQATGMYDPMIPRIPSIGVLIEF